ncbi:MAG: N-acetylmuramoyl-L-alanine amidase [Flavobacteriia bacterium]|jgi:N-acetylmuramoyl-L-alanine amidase
MKTAAFIFSLFLLTPFSFSQKEKIVVVIDAGHGGSDPGHLSCNKNHLAEKELNLLIAKKFGGYIDQYLKNVTIVYTRTDDSFPTLNERVDKANSVRADYFISIHCNANHNKHVHGTESHIHSHTSKKAVDLAKEVEKEFSSRAGRHSRGVKDSEDREHSLQVLKYTNMTGILVECGFMTNENEANYLNTSSGQDVLASALFRAFRSFITKEHPSISFIKTAPSPASAAGASSSGGQTAKPASTVNGTYAIQIMSSKTPLDTKGDSFKNLGVSVARKELNTTATYKYTYFAGTYASKDAAMKDLEKVQKNGFRDAYVVKME